ncbi:MAG: zinc ribbon domain-containing protein [Candidatus Thiodiazotropha sp. (ex Dulcina madagascariensis)]|nr:zinc ribbon domain-containing protein [Candidatus Thiodiazotropha sp. (ex Epidulcina cf. delphinae)]MCU7923694.1 zinc ribbon domain-containing protein [Candidatus Thiodiazotropha sp. (ex Dulcina madagascariensis)]MCU7926947.1 zinc ribbon domain-containing protein [Candidatus Thiodiazotropha sp. (ex Dulcina madagascariensis)]
MPIYEYRCEACGHELEALQKMSDPVLSECPACNKDSLKKLISAAGFRLKGSGWYETDFKGNGKEKGGKESVKERGKSETKSSACNGGSCGCH